MHCTPTHSGLPHNALHFTSSYLCICGEIWTTFLFCCCLTFCSLSKNEITDEGVCALAGALQVNQSLQELEWVNCSFKEVCVHWQLSKGYGHSIYHNLCGPTIVPVQYDFGGWFWLKLSEYYSDLLNNKKFEFQIGLIVHISNLCSKEGATICNDWEVMAAWLWMLKLLI